MQYNSKAGHIGYLVCTTIRFSECQLFLERNHNNFNDISLKNFTPQSFKDQENVVGTDSTDANLLLVIY